MKERGFQTQDRGFLMDRLWFLALVVSLEVFKESPSMILHCRNKNPPCHRLITFTLECVSTTPMLLPNTHTHTYQRTCTRTPPKLSHAYRHTRGHTHTHRHRHTHTHVPHFLPRDRWMQTGWAEALRESGEDGEESVCYPD